MSIELDATMANDGPAAESQDSDWSELLGDDVDGDEATPETAAEDAGPASEPAPEAAQVEPGGESASATTADAAPAAEPTPPPAAAPQQATTTPAAAPPKIADPVNAEALAEIRAAREEVRKRKDEFDDLREQAKEAKKNWEAAVNYLTETIDELTRPMPLFDRTPPAAAPLAAEIIGTVAQAAAEIVTDAREKLAAAAPPPPPTSTELPPEATGRFRVHLLATIHAEGITFGVVGTVVDAYCNDNGDVFLAHCYQGDWKYAYLEAEEFEEVENLEENAGEKSPEPAGSTAPDWRSAAISQLDLPKGIEDRLAEADVSTIGDLEDLRASISNGKARWPKGIGEAKVTRIEDAVIDWLSQNRDRDVLEAAKS